jgi:hypothetical protein
MQFFDFTILVDLNKWLMTIGGLRNGNDHLAKMNRKRLECLLDQL